MRPAALELRAVTAATDARPLTGIDLAVGEGDAVVVIGLPGSGKTSLVRLIAGLDDVATGSLSLFGHDVARAGFFKARALRDRVAVIFERGGIWANRSVAENLVLPVAYRTDRALATLVTDPYLHELLDALELRGIADRPTGALDDSERRRVLLVRALYSKPDLLLVDEPQAALSRAHMRLFASVIERERRARGMTVILTDADGRIDPFEADRPIILHERRILHGAVRLPERTSASSPPQDLARETTT